MRDIINLKCLSKISLVIAGLLLNDVTCFKAQRPIKSIEENVEITLEQAQLHRRNAPSHSRPWSAQQEHCCDHVTLVSCPSVNRQLTDMSLTGIYSMVIDIGRIPYESYVLIALYYISFNT